MAKRGKKSMQTAAADPVTIQYNSNTIGTLADSGRVTLKCADKRMLSDVEINYGVENYAPSAVTSTGDVTITYGEETIGTLSDSGTLSFSTGGTRVEQDINVNYTKPAGQTIGNVLNVQNNLANKKTVNALVQDQGTFLIVNNTLSELSVEPHATGSAILLSYINENKYYVSFTVPSKTDALTVTVNGTPITHSGAYTFTSEASDSVIAGQTYNVVISDKE